MDVSDSSLDHDTLITLEEIKKQVIVFDGGNESTPPVTCPVDLDNWRSIRISEGKHIRVVDTDDPEKGLIHRASNGVANVIRLGRKRALSILPENGLADFIDTIRACEKANGNTLLWGELKKIFGDDGTHPPRYTSFGVQPNRNKPSITPVQLFMKKLKLKHWDNIAKMMRWSEIVYEMMPDCIVLNHINAAKKVISFKTMKPSPSDKHQTHAQYFGAIAFGNNVFFLHCHTDQDYTFSVMQVHLKGRDTYAIDEDTLVYFCFPTLGIAIPLRPGDFLLFNVTIPHCISSRCRKTENVISMSSYLKTAVVGLNDNRLELTEEQHIMLERYE